MVVRCHVVGEIMSVGIGITKLGRKCGERTQFCCISVMQISSSAAERCLLGEHIAESVQFVACQIIPPHGAFLGITVFAYLQNLMQANARSDSSPKAVCQWQQKDSLVSSFDHTLPLCQNSASSNDGSRLSHPWHSVSDLVLCFSPEETSGCSLSEVSVDDDESQEPLALQWSNGVQGAKRSSVKPSETKHDLLLNPSSMSPVKNTSCDQEMQSLSFNQWVSSQQVGLSQLNSSTREKPLVNHISFALDDAPLSESLGDFVTKETEINRKSHSFTNEKDQVMPEKAVLLKKETILMYTSQVQSPHSSFHTRLHDVTNNEESLERKNRKRKSSVSRHTTKLSHVSKELHCFDIKDMVSKRNIGSHVYIPTTKEQENQSDACEDAYNCSADLFHQSSMKVLDAAESFVSETDPKKQDLLACVSIPEPKITSFHFAPSLQSTPIVDPTIQCKYRQRRKPSKKWSGLHWSEKKITRTSHIRGLQNHTNNRQEAQVVMSELNHTWRSDSALETSESSAGGSGLKVDMKHMPGDSALHTTTTVDCSRDLFDPSF